MWPKHTKKKKKKGGGVYKCCEQCSMTKYDSSRDVELLAFKQLYN